MATHPGMLIAYDNDYNVIATLDHRLVLDAGGRPLGLVDFAAHEAAGGDHTDSWVVEQTDAAGVVTAARGSKVWPEWLGNAAHGFRVELAGPPGGKKIAALVHRDSGHRRDRAAVEAAISSRIAEAKGAPADIRDLVGGPDSPVSLDATGRTIPRSISAQSRLPLVRRS